MVKVLDVIELAAASGEPVTIIYRGGSQPGTYREILVLGIRENLVKATCLRSMQERIFSLDKIEVVPKNIPLTTQAWELRRNQSADYQSLTDLHSGENARLIELGWHVQMNETCISLHRRFKNGNPMKGFDILLDYNKFTWDLVFDGVEITQENYRLRERPWTVWGKGKTTRSYREFSLAAQTFVE